MLNERLNMVSRREIGMLVCKNPNWRVLSGLDYSEQILFVSPCLGGEALDSQDAGAGDLRPEAGLGPPRPLPPQPAHALLQPPRPH